MSLDDILITPLARITVAGGDVLHAIKNKEAGYNGFGEAYFSWIDANSVKAWKCHTKMTMNIIVPVGKVRFVFHLDGVEEFRVEEIGDDRYIRVTIPPGIWFGFQGISESQSLVLNVANIPHNPKEVKHLNLSEINYDWD
jgi:dTDP-4-dehydrorhamnose 3,5-epimerase